MHPLESRIAPPERFTYPFAYEPHPLCQLAAKAVQAYIAGHEEIRCRPWKDVRSIGGGDADRAAGLSCGI